MLYWAVICGIAIVAFALIRFAVSAWDLWLLLVSLKAVSNFAKYCVLRKWLFLKATFAKHLISRSGVRSSHAPIYLLFSDCGGVAWANGAQLAECGGYAYIIGNHALPALGRGGGVGTGSHRVACPVPYLTMYHISVFCHETYGQTLWKCLQAYLRKDGQWQSGRIPCRPSIRAGEGTL